MILYRLPGRLLATQTPDRTGGKFHEEQRAKHPASALNIKQNHTPNNTRTFTTVSQPRSNPSVKQPSPERTRGAMSGSGYTQHSLRTKMMLRVACQLTYYLRRSTGCVVLQVLPHWGKATATWARGRETHRGARCAAGTTRELAPPPRSWHRTCVCRTCIWGDTREQQSKPN